MPRPDLHGDRGSATVLAVGIIAVALTVTLGGLWVLSAVRAAHVARASADLAALAAAGRYQELPEAEQACAEARRIAGRHATEVSDCSVEGTGIVTVTTTAPIGLRLAGAGPERAEGRARAGPEPGGAR